MAHVSDMVEQARELAETAQPGGADPLARIVDMFVRESADRLLNLRNAAAARDVDQIERLAHAQRGSAGSVGAVEVARLANGLEQCARAGRLSEIDHQVEALDAAFARTRTALDGFLEDKAA